MIVYGDPSHETTLATLSLRLRSQLANLSPKASLDALRAALIEAGQMEQAVHDALDDAEAIGRCEAATDALAETFVRCWSGQPFEIPTIGELPEDNQIVTVKLPEGFAFYGLYPEGYIVAVQRWLASVRPVEPVAVIGIRSIGTTLSAIVTATLQAEDVTAHRFTVRPGGHPFQRRIEIAPSDLRKAQWALIVDEGPGLSGSSMASVAEAVHKAGIPRDQIAFFPGHGGEPGAHASEETRAWWTSVPRFFTPTEALRWDGQALEEVLADATGDVRQIREISGGAWRELVFSSRDEWPSVALPFERRKILITRRDGSAVLWKYVGLTVPGTTLGFEAQPWVEGKALRREDLKRDVIDRLGRHIASVAGPPLTGEAAVKARERLVKMVRVNLEEAGLEIPTLTPSQEQGGPSAGEYRLAPWEWRRLPNGDIVKTGRISPTLDHTIVGRHPLAWDIAGAMVEWDLDEEAEKALLANAPKVSSEALRFYRLAYAAFRMGMCAMCAGMSDQAEARRLRRDDAFYREAILRLL
ncbi:hypothetical protein EON82_13975 [bacterium]|nr:MAG: hypothetical protein EON82_13975 [bacterium]